MRNNGRFKGQLSEIPKTSENTVILYRRSCVFRSFLSDRYWFVSIKGKCSAIMASSKVLC